MPSTEIVFAADHPTAEGHFPGNPILPGALLLDRALRMIGLHPPVEIRQAKFLAPLRPGDNVTLHWKENAGVVNFEYRLGDAGIPAMTGIASMPE